MDRRLFLGTSAAAALAAAIPMPAMATPEAVVKSGWWGITCNDDIYYPLGVATKEEAIAEAVAQYPNGGVGIAWCDPYKIEASDMRDAITNHMAGDTTDWGECLVRDIIHSNEDADYEGEIEGAIESADSTPLETNIRAALDAALVRHGRPDLVGRDFVESPIDPEDAVLDALNGDDRLDAETRKAAQDWIDANNFQNAGMLTLHVSDEHSLPEIEAA